jgi:hypothetical protein
VYTTCLLRLLTPKAFDLDSRRQRTYGFRKVKWGLGVERYKAPIQCREILMSAPTRSVATSLAKSISNFCQ